MDKNLENKYIFLERVAFSYELYDRNSRQLNIMEANKCSTKSKRRSDNITGNFPNLERLNKPSMNLCLSFK